VRIIHLQVDIGYESINSQTVVNTTWAVFLRVMHASYDVLAYCQVLKSIFELIDSALAD
jgi:hypothetical protein